MSFCYQVCGSNGISYNNECKLKAESCEKQTNIEVKYPGLCSKYRAHIDQKTSVSLLEASADNLHLNGDAVLKDLALGAWKCY